MYIYSMCILKDSKNPELAMEFINFIHRPEIYAMFLDEFNFPATVNLKAEEYVTSTPMYTSSALDNTEGKNDIGEGLEKYNLIWQDIRFTN